MTNPTPEQLPVRLVNDREHYDLVVDDAIRRAQVSIWIGTATVKDLHVAAPVGSRARARGKYISILELLADLGRRGVELRLLHGGLPSGPFRKRLAKMPQLDELLQIRHCPRVHFKMIAIDGRLLYLGSANLTGAGLGAKGDHRRNFEAGILTADDIMLDEMQQRYESIWTGLHCAGCAIRAHCPQPLDGQP